MDFGAFADIGGVDGLVHVSSSHGAVTRSLDVLKVGDDIDVYVKSFDKETRKISLGYKRVEDDPYYNIEERMPLGCIVRGTVVRLTKFGTFVQLEPNLDALCHVSQISSERLEKPEDVLSIGQEVTAQVTEIDGEASYLNFNQGSCSIDPVSDTSDAETTEE